MKKICYLITIILMMLILFCEPVNAATGIEFELKYTGKVTEKETKDAEVILRGTDATTYPKVRVKVEVTGPSKPKIMAVDSAGNQIDIAQTGYWGPPEGFPIAGTFENITPVKVTFDEAGTYKVKLSLINLENANAEITSKTETIEVVSKTPPTNPNTNTNTNEVVGGNNTIEKLPQTGTSLIEYTVYIGIVLIGIVFINYKIKTLKNR